MLPRLNVRSDFWYSVSMEENSTLRGALEVSQRQLAEAEGELREIRERVRNLRAVVFGLKQLLDPGDSFMRP